MNHRNFLCLWGRCSIVLGKGRKLSILFWNAHFVKICKRNHRHNGFESTNIRTAPGCSYASATGGESKNYVRCKRFDFEILFVTLLAREHDVVHNFCIPLILNNLLSVFISFNFSRWCNEWWSNASANVLELRYVHFVRSKTHSTLTGRKCTGFGEIIISYQSILTQNTTLFSFSNLLSLTGRSTR